MHTQQPTVRVIPHLVQVVAMADGREEVRSFFSAIQLGEPMRIEQRGWTIASTDHNGSYTTGMGPSHKGPATREQAEERAAMLSDRFGYTVLATKETT